MEDWGSWEKTWSQEVLGESPMNKTRKRIRNRTRGLGRKGKAEKHELGKVWLEAVALIFHPWEPVNRLNSTPVWMTMLFKSKAYIWSYNIWWNQTPHFKETRILKENSWLNTGLEINCNPAPFELRPQWRLYCLALTLPRSDQPKLPPAQTFPHHSENTGWWKEKVTHF